MPASGTATLRASRPSLADLLQTQAREASVPRRIDAVISLDAGSRHRWTSRLTNGRMEISPGLPETEKETTVQVFTDPETLAAVVQGERSGIEAFLKGDLRVRGNLALALQLDTMFGAGRQPKRWPRAGRVKAAGVDTAYLEAGTGRPVILLHGLGATNASLLPTLWSLGRDHRVIAPDLPGFGDSSKPIRAYSAEFFAQWLTSFLDHLGIEQAALIGNSMGGRVTLEMGMRAPERVDRMVLLMASPAFIRNREWVRLVKILRPELGALPVRLPHRRVVRGIKAMFSRPERLPDTWYDAAADEFLRVFSKARGRVAFFSAARQIYLEEPHGEAGFWDRLPSMKSRALFVWGQRDWLVPAKFARHVESALPDAASVVLADCGHVPQYEMPKKTNKLVRDFLEAP